MYFSIFKDPEGQWRWRIYSGTDVIMVDGSESYKSKQDTVTAIKRIRQPAAGMRIWDSIDKVDIVQAISI